MAWISTDKKNYSLGDEITVNAGDAGSILKPYKYKIYISANDNERILAANDVPYTALKGKKITLTDTYAALAFPYSPGRLLTVTAEGSYKTVMGKINMIKLTSSIYLYGDLYPKFSFKLQGKNDKTCFGTNAVANYSSLKATANEITIKHGGKVNDVYFYGATGEHTITGKSLNEYSAESGIITEAGAKSASCKLTAVYKAQNPDGNEFSSAWSTTNHENITAKRYQRPYITYNFSGSVKPVRVDDDGKDVNYVGSSDIGYSLRFCFKIIADSALGVKIESVSNAKIFNTDDDGNITNYYPLNPSITKDGVHRIISRTKIKPTFGGCLVYKKYPIEIDVDDGVGTYTLKTELPSVQVTAHIAKGGRSIKIGGFATEDYLVAIDKEWRMLVEGDLSCEGAFNGNEVNLKTLSFNGGTKYTGTGTGADKISAGNHTHGNITNDGKLKNVKEGYPLTVDSNGNVVEGATFPYAMYYNGAPKSNGAANGGTSDLIARGDHIHPTDTSRASKVDFDNLKSDYDAFKAKYNGYL